jgi:branched-chain amino acid transport system substrate-binding protein
MQRGRSAGALMVALGLVAACGSQVDRSVFNAAPGSGKGPGRAATVIEEGGDSTGSATGGATATDGGTATDAGGSGAGATGAQPGTASGGGGAANTASDVGVTPNSIKLGNITTVGGPMPGQFEPSLLGIRTWVNEVNEKGGINGRKIQFVPCDDGMDAEKNRACARDLIESQKVFAIIGTNTPAMPSAQYINDAKVPAVGVLPIGNYAWQLPYWFASDGMRTCPRNGVTQAGQPGYCATNTAKISNASYKYFKEQVGVTKAAVFWHNIDISKQAGLDFAHNLEATGIKVVYTAETQVAEPDYTGHVLQMRDRGVEGIWDTMEVNNNIRLMQAMDRQGFTPKAKSTTVASYGQEIAKQVDGPSKNVLFSLSHTRSYTETNNPSIAKFNQLFDKYFKGKSRHIWNVEGYRGGLLFGDAAAALGANLTREGMVKWLNDLRNYDPHGLGKPTDWHGFGPEVFNAPKPPTIDPWCYSIVKFKDTDFFTTPGDGIKCIQGEWIEPRG